MGHGKAFESVQPGKRRALQNTMDTHGTGSDLLFRKVGIRTNSCSEGGDNGFLVLSLGQVDDSDVTYFNGVKIGATGTMHP